MASLRTDSTPRGLGKSAACLLLSYCLRLQLQASFPRMLYRFGYNSPNQESSEKVKDQIKPKVAHAVCALFV